MITQVFQQWGRRCAGTGRDRYVMALLLMGLVLRIVGIGFGASLDGDWVGNWHDDEVAWVAGSISFADLNPHYWGYPALHLYLLYALDLVFYGVTRVIGFSMSTDYGSFILATEVERLLIARFTSLVFSMGVLVLVWKLSRRLFDRTTARAALALAVFNPALVRHAHYGTVDAANAFFVLATVWAAFRVFDDPRCAKRAYVCAALAGCAASVKYLGGVVAFVLPVALWIGIRARGGTWRDALRLRHLWASALTTIVVFFTINIYILLDWNDFITRFTANLAAVSSGGSFFDGWYYGLSFPTFNFFWGSGATLFILVGLLSFAFGKRREGLLLLTFPILFAIVIGKFEWRMSRQVLPAIPLLLIVAARGMAWTGELAGRAISPDRRRRLETAVVALGVGFVVFTTLPLMRTILWIFTHPDTRQDFAEWAVQEIPRGSVAVLEDTGAYGSHLERSGITWLQHNLAPQDDVHTIADLLDHDVEYVVTSSFFTDLAVTLSENGEMSYPRSAGYYDALQSHPQIVPVAVFDKGEFDPDALLGTSAFHYRYLTQAPPSQFDVHNPTIRVYRFVDKKPGVLRDPDGFFPRDSGHAFVFEVPSQLSGDEPGGRRRSSLIIYEDDRPLGPGHSQHDEVREGGAGRFSHWGGRVLFSTSDGSDPNENGRVYHAMAFGPSGSDIR